MCTYIGLAVGDFGSGWLGQIMRAASARAVFIVLTLRRSRSTSCRA